MPALHADLDGLAEFDLIARMRKGDEAAFRAVIQRNNQRLFRIARGILKDDDEAEDAVQEAYVRAFTHLADFRGEARFSTWLTRIVLNEALGRLRARRPLVPWAEETEAEASGQIVQFPVISTQPDPERAMAQHEIRHLLERAIDALPDAFRVVLIARVIEEMSIQETADLFGIRPETVKTRLHRARDMLRKDLEQQVGPLLTETFPFNGARCNRMADAVIARLQAMR
jgi:RNA polymerase sigma-70 factor (ECF subfamily)